MTQVERHMEAVKKGEFSTPKNCETLLRFYDFSKARNLSDNRLIIYFDKLKLACKTIGNKDFEAWDRGDVEKLFSAMGGKGYSAWSIETEKAILKSFFRWLYDTEECPKFLKWLKGQSPPNKLTKETLLAPREIESMIKATNNVMWRALIAAYTSGARPAEIMGARLKDVVDMGDMVKLYVGAEAGKMSKKAPPRPVYVQKFAEYMRPWLKSHPNKGNPEALLFSMKGKVFSQGLTNLIMKRLASRAGLQKKVFPYLFRHSIATWLYSKHDSTYARRIMGHCAGSRMEAVYVHMNEEDVENELRGNKETQNGNSFDFSNNQEIENIGELLAQFASENPAWRENLVREMREWRNSKMGA